MLPSAVASIRKTLLCPAVGAIRDDGGSFGLGRFLAQGARLGRGGLGRRGLNRRRLARRRLGVVLLKPSLHEAARRLGHVEETNSGAAARVQTWRSEEHTSGLQSR